jgi:hypothetical protein
MKKEVRPDAREMQRAIDAMWPFVMLGVGCKAAAPQSFP